MAPLVLRQLRTLLWKNFKCCLRHPYKLLLFYLFPVCISLFMLLIGSLMNKINPDCGYQAMVLPPSHPVLVVASLICSKTAHTCSNSNKGYKEPSEYFDNFIKGSEDSNNSRFCPQLTMEEMQEALGMALFSTCMERPEGLDYKLVSPLDLMFRGDLLYYPKNDSSKKIMAKAAAHWDKINLLKTGLVMYGTSLNDTAPSMKQALAQLANAVVCFKPLAKRTFGFSSKTEAIAHAHKLNFTKGEAVWAIVDFEQIAADFRYSLISHFNHREKISNVIVQSLIETAAVEHLTKRELGVQIAEKMLPVGCHKDPMFFAAHFGVVQLMVAMSVLPVLHFLCTQMGAEKVTGLLECLLIAGVPRYVVKLSWMLFGLVFVPTVTLVVGLLIYSIDSMVLQYTDLSLYLTFFTLYGLALLSLCFLVASVMNTAQKAGIAIIVLLIMGWVAPGWSQLLPDVGYDANIGLARTFSLLHSAVAVQLGVAYMFEWEKLSIGTSWSNFGQSPMRNDRFHGVKETMVHLVIQCIVYLLLATYFDLVMPSIYGSNLPWYFPCSPAHWKSALFGTKRARKKQSSIIVRENEADVEKHQDESKTAGIVLTNLTKRYGGDKMALDHVSMTLYQKEITAILGHNGAGKSTTMNMLTGMLQPSSGTALIDGKDIRAEMTEIRQNVGFCPQYDIIYADLTPEEHIRFYGELKGIGKAEYEAYASKLFSQMDIPTESLNTPVANLSGGIKRKLSITIAFLGQPTTVILDEPTSAIDPFSRRAIWDVILSYRSETTCLISTHYMQEADILGDRIAIINDGHLKCVGTKMYLKSKYGSGFFLKLSHRDSIESLHLETKLRQFIPQVQVVSSSSTETAMSIPLDSARSSVMIDAFKYLEANGKQGHGIETFGIAESTMEQVFFNVAAEETNDETGNIQNTHSREPSPMPSRKNDSAVDLNDSKNASQTDVHEVRRMTGCGLLLMQFGAVLVKRFHLARKSKAAFIFQMVMPLFFAVLMFTMDGALDKIALGGETIHTHLWHNKMQSPVMFYAGPSGSPIINSWLNYGIGTKCATGSAIEERGGCNRNVTPNIPQATEDYKELLHCHCKECPENSTAKANSVMLQTGDMLLNLEKRNVTDFLLKSKLDVVGGIEHISRHAFHGKSLIPPFEGGIGFPGFGEDSNIFGKLGQMLFKVGKTANETKETPFNVQELMKGTSKYIEILQNTAPPGMDIIWTGVVQPLEKRRPSTHEVDMRYTPLAFLNGYYNILLRSKVSSDSNLGSAEDYKITLTTKEVSMSASDISLEQGFSAFMLGMFSSMALLMPTFLALIIMTNERVSGLKQLQHLMGLNGAIYWSANFLWDMTLYIVSIGLVVLFMYCFPAVFKHDLLVYSECAFAFGVSMILCSYVMSLFVSHAFTAIMLEFLLSPFFTIAAWVLFIFRKKDWHDTAEVIGLLAPPYFIGDSLMMVSMVDMMPFADPLWSWNMLGKRFALNALFSLAMLVILICFESGLVDTLRCGGLCRGFNKTNYASVPTGPEKTRDADVIEEEQKLADAAENHSSTSQTLLVSQLRKEFGRKTVVNDVSFGVGKRQCFGLLGVNGAGKTTLFKMLTGYYSKTSGSALLNNHPLFSRIGARAKLTKSLSYCPQENVLHETLTPIEHLHYYGKLRGLILADRTAAVDEVIRDVGLTHYKNKMSRELSGGNKRKLNFAISMVDARDLVLLDEMTTGMDPRARKSAWSLVRKAMVKRGCSVIVTSHSMEECEGVCNRLVIMVNGSFCCIGGVQYLKDKFGNNYSVKFRLQPGKNAEAERILTIMSGAFEGAELSERHLDYIEVKMPAHSLLLSELYHVIHTMKEELHIEDFSVSQTTLEHVFVNMVKEQA